MAVLFTRNSYNNPCTLPDPDVLVDISKLVATKYLLGPVGGNATKCT